MSNVFINLPVPVAPGIGPAVVVSGIAPQKSLVLEGPGGLLPAETGANGVLILESSQDGVHFAPLLTLNLLADPRVPPFAVVCSHMRIRRAAGFGGNVILGVAGESSSSNVFGAFVVPGDGAGVPLDTSTLGIRKTVIVIGPYSGVLVIEGSADAGATYDPVLTCDSKNSGVYVFSGIWEDMRVRRVGNTTGVPIVTVGGHPGGGGAAGVNSCLLCFGGDYYLDSAEPPIPFIAYYANTVSDWYAVDRWDYSLPVGGSASGLRIDVSSNTFDVDAVFNLVKNGVVTSQTVTVPAGLTGAFITAGVAASYAADDLLAFMVSSEGARMYSEIYFSAVTLYTIS
jgi:hypothetical protein